MTADLRDPASMINCGRGALLICGQWKWIARHRAAACHLISEDRSLRKRSAADVDQIPQVPPKTIGRIRHFPRNLMAIVDRVRLASPRYPGQGRTWAVTVPVVLDSTEKGIWPCGPLDQSPTSSCYSAVRRRTAPAPETNVLENNEH